MSVCLYVEMSIYFDGDMSMMQLQCKKPKAVVVGAKCKMTEPEQNKIMSEHYSKVAQDRLGKIGKETFLQCETREEFSDYLLNIFIAYYDLRCTCADVQDWEFHQAASHYHNCDLWKFCHAVNRALDWSKKHKKEE